MDSQREVTADSAARNTEARGAQGRVAAVHHQTRRGLGQAAVFTLLAVIAVVAPHRTGFWLPLHLFVLGALLSAISSTTQMLAVTWSTAPAPPAWVARAQRWCLAAGTVAICAGREADIAMLVDIGGTAVVVSVVALVPILLTIRRRALTDRFAPAIEGYISAMVLGAVGIAVAIAMATGRVSEHWVKLRDVHVILNLFGLVGLVVAATLPYFSATQSRRKMSPRATPAAVRAVVALLAVATTLTALGRWFTGTQLSTVGLVAYAIGLAAIAAMLPIYGRRQFAWAATRLVQLVAGIAWWAVSTVVLALVFASGGDERPVLIALVVGGFGQILASSVAYLGPVLRGGGHELLTAGFATTRSWLSVAAGNVAALAALVEQRVLFGAALLVWAADMSIRGVVLVASRTAS